MATISHFSPEEMLYMSCNLSIYLGYIEDIFRNYFVKEKKLCCVGCPILPSMGSLRPPLGYPNDL
jgi:hypothetical protein